MSSILLNSAISGINAMKVMIDNTVKKINRRDTRNLEKQVFLENTAQNSKVNDSIRVQEIYDDYNDFITEERRKTDAQVEDEKIKIEQLLKLEDLLCEKYDIFGELTNEIYQQIKKNLLSSEQNKIDSNLKNKANHIIISLKDFDRKLKFLEKDVRDLVVKNVSEANELINQIHDTTIDIRYFPVAQLPNRVEDFIEKRERLVDRLNKLIGIKVVKDKDSYKIFLHDGICIIDNNHKQNLVPLTSSIDNRYFSVGYLVPETNEISKIENMIPTAIIGSLLKFRKEELADARNTIGQLTVSFADCINNMISSYSNSSDDEFGHLGTEFFNISDPEIIASSTNHSSPMTLVQWISPRQAQSADYGVYLQNNEWKVINLSNKKMITSIVRQNENNDNTIIEFDGIAFNIQGKSSEGDIYMIKPYSKTLEKIEVLVDENNFFDFNSIDDSKDGTKSALTDIQKKLITNPLLYDQESINKTYQEFSKSIAYKSNKLEEELPFKKNMLNILQGKKASMFSNIEKEYETLDYEQKCYLANVRVMQVAEEIFNEIITCFS